jgi:hypothetical protein
VLTFIVKITGGLYAVLAVIVTIMTITRRFICSVNSYCEKKGERYMQ